ncbi:MAG: SufD family Fe-S cluster assembly protein [Candidatus Micrarchaeia archaeon]
MADERVDYIYKNYRIVETKNIHEGKGYSQKELKEALKQLVNLNFDFMVVENEVYQDYNDIKASNKKESTLDLSGSASLLIVDSNLNLSIKNSNNNNIIIVLLGSSNLSCMAELAHNASITLVDLSSSSSNSLHISSSSSLIFNILSFSKSSKIRAMLNAFANSSIKLNTAFLMDNSTIDSEVLAYNKDRNSSISIHSNAALFNSSRCLLKSYAELEKGAKDSRSDIIHRCIVLNEKAHADSIPVMSVKDKDAYAAHSSSIIPFDSEFSFYANTRGIDSNEAKKIEAQGLMELVSRSINDDYKSIIEHLIEEKLKMIK